MGCYLSLLFRKKKGCSINSYNEDKIQLKKSFLNDNLITDNKNINICNIASENINENESEEIMKNNDLINDIMNEYYIDNNNYEQILNKCKYNPESIMNYNFSRIDKNDKEQILCTFAIKIFKTHQEDSIIICKDNIGLITYYISKQNKKLADLLEIENIDNCDIKKKIYKNAYAALSKHKYGVAYVLFNKVNDKKGMKQIYDKYIPTYLKNIVNFHEIN